ncbi:MAG: dTDP-4-dehydrorhamnose reductase [Candidatus Gracilibacteria bacterium]|jgi:dTDP-4-dehydrorhamnose reductase|nr:dTDP-4-dehydrorhamnose reductase [Candidatus Gracilibacteria bacterium]
MKILLLGKNGLLGNMFLKQISALEGLGQVFAFGHSDLDILDFPKLRDTVSTISPDFVINCVAYTDVIKAEQDERELALKLNYEVLKHLSLACKSNGTKLIHFSTDYVFDGEKNDFYNEDDKPNPLNYYGHTKLLGENAIQDEGCDFAIARTAWLFGPNGRNFVDRMIELSKTNPVLKIVNDKVGSPTYTYDLAKSVLDNFILNKIESGIFHIVNEGALTRFEEINLAFEFKKIDNTIMPVSSDEFPSIATVPSFSALSNNKLTKLRSCKDALKAYLS